MLRLIGGYALHLWDEGIRAWLGASVHHMVEDLVNRVCAESVALAGTAVMVPASLVQPSACLSSLCERLCLPICIPAREAGDRGAISLCLSSM